MAKQNGESGIVDDVEDEVVEVYDTAESWVERKLADARDAVRDEPIKMVAIAAGVGALLGAIFLR